MGSSWTLSPVLGVCTVWVQHCLLAAWLGAAHCQRQDQMKEATTPSQMQSGWYPPEGKEVLVLEEQLRFVGEAGLMRHDAESWLWLELPPGPFPGKIPLCSQLCVLAPTKHRPGTPV